MRLTYKSESVAFPDNRITTAQQTPTQIVVHRQGNPGVEGEAGIRWMARTGAASIHYYVDDDTVWSGVPEDRHAFHVAESRRVSGRPTWGLHGLRGDYNTIGVECEDEDRASGDLAPGQRYGLSQETRISLVVLLATLCYRRGLKPDVIIFHSTLDPWTRPEDPGNALNLEDLRADVAYMLADETPWRTVGRWATGARLVDEQPPTTTPAPHGTKEITDLSAYERSVVFGKLYAYAVTQGKGGSGVSMHVEPDRVTFTVLRKAEK